LVGTGLLAGCGSSDDGGEATPTPDGGGAAPTETATDTSTVAETATTEPTTTAASPSFVVESFEGPDEVSIGEQHRLEITVRNTGDVAGTYEGRLRFSTSQTTDWSETNIEIGPIEPGETETLTSDPITFDQPMEVQYIVLDADAGHTYEVIAPDAGLEVGRSGLVEVDLGYDTIQMAEVAVTNTGDGIAGVANITVDWFDANDDYLASTSVRTRGLRAGETWLARASPRIDIDNDDAIERFEVSPGQARPTTASGPEGVTVSNAQHRASSEEVIVRASATNTRDTQIDYLEFVGKVYNDADEVIGHYWTNETEVSAGETVRFEGNPDTNGRSGQVTAHEILLTTEAL